ncbi:MAG: response regulator [bacterium]|nr:response regulator [bacterium]
MNDNLKKSPAETAQTRYLAVPPPQVTETETTRPTQPFEQGLPWVLEFRVVGTSDTLQVQVRGTMLMGRADIDRNIFPEIDLTPYNAGVLGVSRRHAMITLQESALMLQDLGSTNGTYHNGRLLSPLAEVRLRHGDELMLGGLALQVQYSVVPAELDTKPATAPLTYDATIPNVGKGQHVLVIEDDDSVGEVFRRALTIAGFKTSLVHTVMQGLGLCFAQMPDAIILNVMLADMNALDLVRYVKKTAVTPVPVIVLSPTNGGFYKNQAYAAGADLVLPKPVAVEDMVRSLGLSFAK